MIAKELKQRLPDVPDEAVVLVRDKDGNYHKALVVVTTVIMSVSPRTGQAVYAFDVSRGRGIWDDEKIIPALVIS